jgi:hypothetical protein
MCALLKLFFSSSLLSLFRALDIEILSKAGSRRGTLQQQQQNRVISSVSLHSCQLHAFPIGAIVATGLLPTVVVALSAAL